MPHRYQIFDVFTDTPLAGNPLAIVHGADDLDDARMQAIAAEFNLSETIFLRAPADPLHAASVRIFTPKHELPFAGHPTVGAAVALASDRAASAADAPGAILILEEKVGLVRCAVTLDEGSRSGFAEFDCPRLAAVEGAAIAREGIARGLGLDSSDIGFENHRPVVASAGVSFLFVPLSGLAAMARVEPDPGRWKELPAAAGGGLPAYLYCRETVDPDAHFHARMIAPGFGIAEDPATGSAAAAFAAALARFDDLRDGRHEFRIEQGVEMGRPSRIRLGIDIAGTALAAVRIGGHAVRLAEGTLDA